MKFSIKKFRLNYYYFTRIANFFIEYLPKFIRTDAMKRKKVFIEALNEMNSRSHPQKAFLAFHLS